LRDDVMRQCATRLFAFVHLSANGLNKETTNQGELMDMNLVNVDQTVRCIRDNPEGVVGLKVRIDDSALKPENALPALELAREAANQAGCRIMVHVSRSPVPLSQILNFLRAGDIVTHPFHGSANGPLGGPQPRNHFRQRLREGAFGSQRLSRFFGARSVAGHHQYRRQPIGSLLHPAGSDVDVSRVRHAVGASCCRNDAKCSRSDWQRLRARQPSSRRCRRCRGFGIGSRRFCIRRPRRKCSQVPASAGARADRQEW
jgi:hypothetical protein